MKNSEINIDDFWKSKELLTAYSEDNYKVVDLSGKSKTCIIFFSSNGLYYPNEVKTLKKEIINNDYYEWLNVSKSVRIQRYAKRIIYVRDIYKQWYVVGINCRYNTIEKTTELLEYLSDGYEIITVGGVIRRICSDYFWYKIKCKKDIFIFRAISYLGWNRNVFFIK